LEGINFSVTEKRNPNLSIIADEPRSPVFTITFTDNQNLSFQEQGTRLRSVVNKILKLYPGRDVILFGHSMGGLASRACIMQDLFGIVGLVTVGTPHAGSFLAYTPNFVKTLMDPAGMIGLIKSVMPDGSWMETYTPNFNKVLIPYRINDLANLLELSANTQHLSLSSKAIAYLAPNSPEMMAMYKQVFPVNLPLVNVLSQWDPGNSITENGKKILLQATNTYLTVYKSRQPVPADMMSMKIQLTKSDGVVSVPSQYIKTGVANAADLKPEVFFTDRFHTEETRDLIVMQQALDKILELADGTQPPNKKEGKPTIAFIIDSSGSMKSSDPNDIRKSSVEQIVDLLSGNENIFLIDFDDKSKWLTSSNWNNWNRQDLKSAIKSIDSDGGTNIGLGFQTLREALEQNMTDFSRTAVVFLSDGKGTYKDEAQWFASKGIKIYTISYKNEADANLLNSIASSTGGIYIQANNESDVVAAFMQFNNDLQGLSKYVSYHCDFNGQSSVTVPSFYVDNQSNLLTVILNWSGVQKLIELISSSGKVYKKSSSIAENSVKLTNLNSYIAYSQEVGLSEHGPVSISDARISTVINNDVSDQEWIDGPGYTIVKIKNPEPGEWNATLNTAGSVVCNDAFLFEAMGDAGKEIKINESRSAGTYLYNLRESDPDLLWEKSKASIVLETPVGNKVDISANFRGGDFFFYPSNGIGSYQINATIWVTDSKNNTYQRQFSRSELVGELLPGYIAPVKETMGTYLITEQGKITGNRSGIKCFIYAPGGSSSAPKALGYVTFVNERQCTIEISGVVKGRIEKGDFVELDVLQWKNDK